MASAGAIIVYTFLILIFVGPLVSAAISVLVAAIILLSGLVKLVAAGGKLCARAVARSARSCLRFTKLAPRPGTYHEADSVSTVDPAASPLPMVFVFHNGSVSHTPPDSASAAARSRAPIAPRTPPAVAFGGARDIDSFTVTGEQALQACAICLEPFGWRRIAAGPCGHQFHAGCITGWLAHDGTSCPVCRAQLDAGARTPHALSVAPV